MRRKKEFVCSNGETVADTDIGKLKGYLFHGVYTFHGIRYAVARRFHSSKLVTEYDGITEAFNYGATAPMLDVPDPKSELFVPHRFWPESEDCLYLNIWTKTLEREKKQPVIVWLHGGGYFAGSSMEQEAYEGGNLAKAGDAVVVTLNHRVNLLGFADLSEYGETYANTVNLGLEDIVNALRWVQLHIRAFGGDPENVTLVGQSGGGMKIAALMQTPEADGLFQKAFIMSGIDYRTEEYGHTELLVEEMLQELQIRRGDAAQLEEIPLGYLMEVCRNARGKLAASGIDIQWMPQKTDWYQGNALQYGFRKESLSVPLIIGTTFAEFHTRVAVPDKWNIERKQREQMLRKVYGEKTELLLKTFRTVWPDKNELDLMEIDTTFRPVTLRYIKERTAAGATKTYSYLFTPDFEIDGGCSAWHCSDIPFLFQTTGRIPYAQLGKTGKMLEQVLSGSLINLAHHGEPERIPQGRKVEKVWSTWKPVTQENCATLIMDQEFYMDTAHDELLLDRVLEAKQEKGKDRTQYSANDVMKTQDWIY